MLGSTCTQFFSVDILLKLCLCTLGTGHLIGDVAGDLILLTLSTGFLGIDIGNASLRLIVDVLLKSLLNTLGTLALSCNGGTATLFNSVDILLKLCLRSLGACFLSIYICDTVSTLGVDVLLKLLLSLLSAFSFIRHCLLTVLGFRSNSLLVGSHLVEKLLYFFTCLGKSVSCIHVIRYLMISILRCIRCLR